MALPDGRGGAEVSRRFGDSRPPRELVGVAIFLWLVAAVALSVMAIRSAQAADACAEATARGDQVVNTTTDLGMAMVERAETEEWHARSIATADVERLTSVLEVETPRYEAARDRCLELAP